MVELWKYIGQTLRPTLSPLKWRRVILYPHRHIKQPLTGWVLKYVKAEYKHDFHHVLFSSQCECGECGGHGPAVAELPWGEKGKLPLALFLSPPRRISWLPPAGGVESQRAVVLFDRPCSRSRRCQILFGARRGTRRTPASYELMLPGRRGSRF